MYTYTRYDIYVLIIVIDMIISMLGIGDECDKSNISQVDVTKHEQ